MSLVVGMIGLVHPHSPMHLQTLQAHIRVDGIVLCDSDATALARAAAVTSKTIATVADVGDLLARQDVSVVLITLPNVQTPTAITRAANAGKHILCEKPCARSAADLQPAVEAIERNNVKFASFYVWRAKPAIRKMRELVGQGVLGRLTSAELRMVTSQVARRDPSHWLFQRDVAGGGIASWLGCHWLDLLRYVTGQEVDEIVALTANVGGEPIDVEDVASASLRLSGGGIAGFYAGYLLDHGKSGYSGADYDRAFVLRGTKGDLSLVNDGEVELVVLERADAETLGGRSIFRYPPAPSPAYGGGSGLDFVSEFLEAAVTGLGDGPASIHESQRVLAILDALYESAATGRVVRVVPPVGPTA
jgi:predicted dehydrogenase